MTLDDQILAAQIRALFPDPKDKELCERLIAMALDPMQREALLKALDDRYEQLIALGMPVEDTDPKKSKQ